MKGFVTSIILAIVGIGSIIAGIFIKKKAK